MQIHVARPPTQLGVFSQEEVAAGLQAGRFLPTDLGWREGMSAWMPLSQWEEFSPLGIPSAPSEFVPAASAQPMPAWERGASIGNYFSTIRDVALNPVETFDNLPATGGFSRPLIFNYLSIGPAVLLFLAICGILLAVGGEEMMTEMREDQNLTPWMRSLTAGEFMGLLVACGAAIFVFVPLLNFLVSAATHLLLLPWGPKGGYAGCFRANSYVSGSLFLVGFIPCVGNLAMPWQIVVNVIALSRVHQLAWWKVAISVVLIPLVVCCGGLFVLVFDSMTGGGGP